MELARKERRFFEMSLIILVLGMATLFGVMRDHGLTALNLFFLPIVLCGYFLGRSSAGVLALLGVLAVTGVAAAFPAEQYSAGSPVAMGLTLTTWAAVLGLTAILVGTLCDQRARYLNELHRAYVGVVEVLSKYLQSADPLVKARSIRVAEMSVSIAQEMRLSRKQIDDVRVAALLYDLENIEITTQLANRAVSALETQSTEDTRHTFMGTDLVQSLGAVLEGALPLLLTQDEAIRQCLSSSEDVDDATMPLGAEIILVSRRYDAVSARMPDSDATLQRVREEFGDRHGHVLDALESVVHRPRELALVH